MNCLVAEALSHNLGHVGSICSRERHSTDWWQPNFSDKKEADHLRPHESRNGQRRLQLQKVRHVLLTLLQKQWLQLNKVEDSPPNVGSLTIMDDGVGLSQLNHALLECASGCGRGLKRVVDHNW